MNKIELNFVPCTPGPPRGYNIQYRVSGSSDSYTDAGNFFVSPAIFYDTINLAGTCYEGYIVAECATGVIGNPVNWESCMSGSGDPPGFRTLRFSVVGGGVGANIKAEFSNSINVALSIDSVFVDGYMAASCIGSVDSHLHSITHTISSGNTAYIGADASTGAWIGIDSISFYGIVLSWPGNSSVIAHNGDVVIMGSYSVTIIIDGC